MEEQQVREHAQAHCAALLAGDIDRAAQDFSEQLRSNMGALISLMPLPLTEATVESVELAGHGYVAVLRMAGEGQAVSFRTRWKDRDGRPTIVEASHVVEQAASAAVEEAPEQTSEG
jgi:hypothetical protein